MTTTFAFEESCVRYVSVLLRNATKNQIEKLMAVGILASAMNFKKIGFLLICTKRGKCTDQVQLPRPSRIEARGRSYSQFRTYRYSGTWILVCCGV